MQYSFNNFRKIPKLTQLIPGIYNNFYYKILGYFWGVTVPTTSSASKSKESLSPSTSERFLPFFSSLEGGGSALYAGGLQTVIGITSNEGSAALPEESLAFAAEPERGCELGALGTSAGGSDTCP